MHETVDRTWLIWGALTVLFIGLTIYFESQPWIDVLPCVVTLPAALLFSVLTLITLRTSRRAER